jgi:hypothetical protein
MRVTGWLVALTVLTSLAACGGSQPRTGGTSRASAQTHPAVSPGLALLLPASTGGPTSCTVYESGYATQVVFDSQSLNVTGECQAWTSREPGSGYLWSYQPTDTAMDETAVSICDLRDPSGRITAMVIEDTGFAPVSAAERQTIATACSRLASAGWVRLRAPRGTRAVS